MTGNGGGRQARAAAGRHVIFASLHLTSFVCFLLEARRGLLLAAAAGEAVQGAMELRAGFGFGFRSVAWHRQALTPGLMAAVRA